MLTLYNNLLNRSPFLTKIFTNGIFTAAGDVLCQTAVEKKSLTEVDWTRVGLYGFYGTVISGPFYAKWFGTLDKKIAYRVATTTLSKETAMVLAKPKNRFRVPTLYLKNEKHVLVTKVLLDQFIGSPIIISMFFAGGTALNYLSKTGTMDVKCWTEIKDKFQHKFLPTFKTDLMVWPLTMMVGFAYVPSKYQIIYVGVGNILWNAYLSYASNGEGH